MSFPAAERMLRLRPPPLVALALLGLTMCGPCCAAPETTPAAQESSVPAGATADAGVATDAAAAADTTAAAAAKADEHSEFHGTMELDNQYSAGTEPLRATLTLSYSDLFSKQDELSALYELAPQDAKQVGVFVANYASHPLPHGLQPAVYFLDSSTNVPSADAGGVLGKGQILGLRLSHALGAAATQSFALALDYRHFRNTTSVNADSSSVTPVSYLNLSLAYSGNWSNTRRETALMVSANYGPRGGANEEQALAAGDFRARANYFFLRADGALLAALPQGLRLYVRLAGQYSKKSLIVDESYPVAGIDGVRGYLEAELLGDRALKGTVQLQSPYWTRGAWRLADGFIFFDAAFADTLQSFASEPSRVHPRSYGVGADIAPWKSITASLIWARALVSANPTQAGDSRLLFLVRAAF